LPNIFPILPGLTGLARSVLSLPDGTPRTGSVEPPVRPTPLTDALARIDLPYYRPPVRPWYPPMGGGTGGSLDGQQAPPFGPPPIYVMPPVWVGAPYRPWRPYGGVPLPPVPPDLLDHEPWWLRGPVLRRDPIRYREIEPQYGTFPYESGYPITKPDMPSIQPVPSSAPPPQPEPVKPTPPPLSPRQPEPVKTTSPKQPTTWDYWDYWREGRQD
jgi:hypothetical protein